MKRYFSTLSICSLFSPILAFSALPPMAQSTKEIQAIIRSDFLRSEGMTAESVLKIEKTDQGFLLETTHFIIPILIHYIPRENAGPSLFQVEFLEEQIAMKDLR